MRSSGRRPNILLLLPDQWRRDWTGFPDGAGIRTPNLARLAARGVRFTNAFTPSPLCAPARACLASGRRYDRAGVRSNADSYPLDQPTVYQALRDAGYSVLGCGKFDLHKPEYSWGRDGTHLLAEWGFTGGVDSEGKIDGVVAYDQGTPGPYLSYLEDRGLARRYAEDMQRRGHDQTHAASLSVLDDHDYGDNWVARQALDLIAKAPADRPWFLQVNFPGPHPPFDITRSMAELYANAPMPIPEECSTPRDRTVALRRNYSAMTENIDQAIGEILDCIEARGELDQTLIVFSSDHGEMLGDRDLWGKNLPYNHSLGVPLIVTPPTSEGGRDSESGGSTIEAPVSILDLPATALDAAGVAVPEAMDSVSLLPLLSGEKQPGQEVVTSALSTPKWMWRAAIDCDYKLIVHDLGDLELYRYRDDPDERHNVAQQEREQVERLSEHLPPTSPFA